MLFLVKSNSEFSSEALEEAKATLSRSSFFVRYKGKDYYRVVSVLVEELGFDCCSYYGHSHRSHQVMFSQFFLFFWVRRYNKTLNDWPFGKQWVFFPKTFNVPPGESLGNIEALEETKLTPSHGEQSLIAYISDKMTLKRHVITFIFLLKCFSISSLISHNY